MLPFRPSNLKIYKPLSAEIAQLIEDLFFIVLRSEGLPSVQEGLASRRFRLPLSECLVPTPVTSFAWCEARRAEAACLGLGLPL